MPETESLRGSNEVSLICLSRIWTFCCIHSGRMATTPQIPASAPVLQNSAPATEVPVLTGGQALVPTSHEADSSVEEAPEVTGVVALLPIEVDVAVPVRNFRVHNLLALEQGQVIETLWHSGEDVPLASGNVQLAWSEFEVIETDLAVRITRLV
jgi:flagellar motor switch/type III secretory pathway protein FliN